MSVGHTYMHGGRFPPPTIPEIPANFDDGLPKTKPSETVGLAAGSKTPTTVPSSTPETSAPGPEGMIAVTATDSLLAPGEPHKSSGASESSAELVGCGDPLQDLDTVPDESRSDDGDYDYTNELSDKEFHAYNEMYEDI